MLKIKRIYDAFTKDDGYRVFVDKLWARGLSKDDAKIDEWAKGIAPSKEIRKQFNHEEEKFEDFEKDYLKELAVNTESKIFLEMIEKKLKLGDVTLLYGAKDKTRNNAVVLKKWLLDKLDLE